MRSYPDRDQMREELTLHKRPLNINWIGILACAAGIFVTLTFAFISVRAYAIEDYKKDCAEWELPANTEMPPCGGVHFR